MSKFFPPEGVTSHKNSNVLSGKRVVNKSYRDLCDLKHARRLLPATLSKPLRKLDYSNAFAFLSAFVNHGKKENNISVLEIFVDNTILTGMILLSLFKL